VAKSVLLVDDSETVLMFERLILRGTGLHLRTANTGTQALAEVERDPPDLILLDVVMPGISGIETCRTLKNDARTRGIPVVMVTTKGEPETVERAFAAGCNDFVTKPIDKNELLAKVQQFLNGAAMAPKGAGR
jgi:CheY-like chemotaxis protein